MDPSTETHQQSEDDVMEQDETLASSTISHDHSSPKLLDCWQQIFNYLKAPSDKLSLFNTLPSLAHHRPSVKSELLLQLALPILMEKERISPDAVVKCRHISKSVKKVVDETLELTQPWWLSLWYGFETAQRMQHFMDYARHLNQHTTPFLAHSCSIHFQSRNSLRTSARMFNQQGIHLRHVRLSINFETTPRYAFRKLIHLLRRLPNLIELEIVDGSASAAWEQLQEGRNLPRLSNLNRLSLKFCQSGQLRPIITPFMTTYGAQIDEFSCNKNAFLAEVPTQTFVSNLPNVHNFQMDHLDMSSALVFTLLSHVQYPVLKVLEFRRDYAENAQEIIFSNETVAAIHNFCLSLEALIMESVDDRFLHLEPALLAVVFPKLRRLSLCTSNASSSLSIWTLFQSNFPNLKQINFVTSTGRNKGPISGSIELRPFFLQFPRLKKITWTHDERPFPVPSVCLRFDALNGI